MTYPPPGDYGQHPTPQGPQSPQSGPPGQPVTGVPQSPAYGQAGYAPAHAPGYGAGPPAPQMPGERPGIVTAGAMSMVAVTIASVICGALMLYAMFAFAEAFIAPEAADDSRLTTQSDVTGFKVTGMVLGFSFLFAGLGNTALALGVLRGRNGARVTTWSVYGCMLMCVSCTALGTLGVIMGITESGEDPFWGYIAMVLQIVQTLAMVAAVILLLLPDANRWFRAHTQARAAGLL